jgi:hypothetical protein
MLAALSNCLDIYKRERLLFKNKDNYSPYLLKQCKGGWRGSKYNK